MSNATDFWDPRNPVQKADRLRFYQRRRFACGLHLESSLQQIHGCLLESQGAGKTLRVAPTKVASVSIPESIRELLSQALNLPPTHLNLPLPATCDLATLGALQFDLTLLAEGLLTQLMAAAGKASDHILAVCLSDLGLMSSLDGQRKIIPLIDAERLAYGTGLNVIDQLPSKDFLSGGDGWPLSAIPLWMLWADRSHPVARQTRLILECDDITVATLLPPSDGLDAEYPNVQQQWMTGYRLLETNKDNPGAEVGFEWESIPAADQKLLATWNRHRDKTVLPMHSNRLEQTRLAEDEMKSVCQRNLPESIFATLQDYWLDSVKPLIDQGLQISESFRMVIIDSKGPAAKFLPDVIRARYPQILVSVAEEFQCQPKSHSAVVAAIMAFLHVDQMPTNLPWITGADHPRILGRLTPGTPSRYRNLLIEMADYRPPVMKLREAI